MRKSGVLMHISSLPSEGGIGTLGKSAYEFVDFLKKAGQGFWQVLPICPTGFGDSPYQSVCTEAGNPYFIDLDMLKEDGLLEENEYKNINWEAEPGQINYSAMYRKRYDILKKAADRFLKDPDDKYKGFCRENAFWLDEYALFMAIKDLNGGLPWYEGDEPLKKHEAQAIRTAKEELKGSIDFWKAVQYFFFRQWKALKKYANEKDIEIIGDLPIYVSYDSVCVWTEPELFQLDEEYTPKEVSGCPPDAFTEDGQLWGNPLYDWEYMAEDDYAWWVKRIDYMCSVFDVLRIDHFRGFESYYAIPAGDKNARRGRWRPGPGIALFEEVKKQLGNKKIIAEDLGFLTPQVYKMLEKSGFPGMKVLEFAFDRNNPGLSEYLPYYYNENCIAYVGTHDNDTALGWYESLCEEDKKYVKTYLGLSEEEGIEWGLMRSIWASKAKIAIVQAQDILGLGSCARMNTPSTTGSNWRWRSLPGSFTDMAAQRIRYSCRIFGRT